MSNLNLIMRKDQTIILTEIHKVIVLKYFFKSQGPEIKEIEEMPLIIRRLKRKGNYRNDLILS